MLAWNPRARQCVTLAWGVILRRRVAAQPEIIRNSIESTADGILVMDGRRRIIVYNQKFAEMWGLPPELLGSRDDRG